MPTSSQARILTRLSVSDIEALTTCHRGYGGVDGRYGRYGAVRSSPALLPQIGLQACPPPYMEDTYSNAGLAPLTRLPRRLHMGLFYPDGGGAGGFNRSNNTPSDVEPKNGQHSDDADNFSQEPSKVQSEAVTSKLSKTEDSVNQAPGKLRRQSTEPTRRPSIQQKPPTKAVDKKRGSLYGGGRRKSKVDNDFQQSRPRAGSQQLRKERFKSQTSPTYYSVDSSSESTKSSFNFEIDLLSGVSSTRADIKTVEDEEEKEKEEEEEKVVPQQLDIEPVPRRPTIKSLYKQLLTIGLTTNAFRGIVVQTAEGERKEATEEEAEKAVEAIVTDIVSEEGSDIEEEEEDDEEEDMELVMGSLLCDVAHYIEVEPEQPSPEAEKKKPSAVFKPVPAAPPPKAEKPREQEPVVSHQGENTSADRKQQLQRQLTVEEKRAIIDEFIPDERKLMDAYNEPAVVEQKGKTEADEQKAFLQQVVAGAAFKPAQGKKEAPKPKAQDEQPKKKVMKIPPIRLRRVVPVANPDLLCIRTPCVDLTHEQVKNMLESQLGSIITLQHDPEYLQYGEVHLPPRVMWIFKMEDCSTNNYIKVCLGGVIGYDGEKLRIRKRDDVFSEENRAYLLVQKIKDEQRKRMMKNKGKEKAKPQPPPKAQKTA